MTMTQDNPTPYLTIVQYAEAHGVSDRTIKRWLKDDELAGAYKDERGRWLIPATAERTAADVVILSDRPRTRPRTDVVASHPSRATLAELIDTLPSFLPIDHAAELLGISRHAILTPRGRDYFDVVPFGPNGSLVVPLATIKKIRG